MAKTENLYLFEIKQPLIGESSYSCILEAINKVANPSRLEWLREWEYCDMLLDVVLFVFS